MNTLWTAISFIIIFTVIVVSHEFGHYLIGRLNGIGVEEFTIGMGPAIFKKKGKHTTFAIRLFPIGGACIFKGMGMSDESDDETFEELNSRLEELSGRLAQFDDTLDADMSDDELAEAEITQAEIAEEIKKIEAEIKAVKKEIKEKAEEAVNDIEVYEDGYVMPIKASEVREKYKGEIEAAEAVMDSDADMEVDGVVVATDDYKAIAFNEAPVWARISTVAAGPIFNVILAFLFSIFLCWFCGSDRAELVDVMDGYPAQAAGLQAGDVITRIDNQKIYLWREISVCSMLNYGETFEIEYERDGQRHVTTITPQFDEETNRYYIGFIGGNIPVECKDLSVFKYSLIEVRYWLITTYRSLLFMFSGHASVNDLSGPVGIATVIDDTIEETSQYGVFTVILNLVNITVLLSVNLGVFNVLPFPALDGGRLVLLFIEAVTGKKVPADKEGLFHFIGFVLLMILMVVVLFNDFIRAFGG